MNFGARSSVSADRIWALGKLPIRRSGFRSTGARFREPRAIVEATLPEMNVELSQGSHFFHNLSSFRASYFMVHDGRFSRSIGLG